MTSEKPHFHGHRERLRQRLLVKGPETLADYEILELLLFGAKKLAHGEIRAADHADLAVTPRLAGDEFDHLLEVGAFLRTPMIPGATRIVGATHVGNHLNIAARPPELGQPGFVLAKRRAGQL